MITHLTLTKERKEGWEKLAKENSKRNLVGTMHFYVIFEFRFLHEMFTSA